MDDRDSKIQNPTLEMRQMRADGRSQFSGLRREIIFAEAFRGLSFRPPKMAKMACMLKGADRPEGAAFRPPRTVGDTQRRTVIAVPRDSSRGRATLAPIARGPWACAQARCAMWRPLAPCGGHCAPPPTDHVVIDRKPR